MRPLMPLLAAVALVLSTAAAHADLGDQLFKLLPDDGAALDIFGFSVAISDATAIVGALGDDDNGSASGSAYLFDTTTGQQIHKLLANDGAPNDWFGRSVAISGETAIVGANNDDDNGENSGSAYLFDISDPADPTQIAKLLPDDGADGDRFGWSVAISGTTVILSAPTIDGLGSGSAYLFDISDPANPTQIAKLLPDDGADGDWTGWSVAISGTTAVVGAHKHDDNGTDSGAAYLFDTASGEQIAKLLPEDGAAHDRFGISVAISGTTVLVGADHLEGEVPGSNSAYLFDVTTGQQIAELLPDDGAESNRFGWSAAISGTTAIVGAHSDDDNGSLSGSAYLFDITTGQQIARLLPDDGTLNEIFGYSVAISGTTAIAGAPWAGPHGTLFGSAYLFDAAACPWDLDSDDDVDAADLAGLLGAWGPNPGHPADLDGDGEIGPTDLAILLENWGPCP